MRLECETSFYNDEKLDTDITTAQETAETAQETAEEAAKTATNFLYQSEDLGLVVSQSPVTDDTDVAALSTPNSRVVSDGFDVYSDGVTRVAHFGETTTIGESGLSQLEIDSTSLSFNAGNGETKFFVGNNVEGSGYSAETFVEVSDTDAYLNGDGTLNETTLATIISDTTDALTMTSSTYDYVTSTTGAVLTMELTGYAISGGVSTDWYSASSGVGCSKTLSDGILTVNGNEGEAADWTDFVTDFAALFPSGSTNHKLYFNFTLTYPIADAQLTIGSRKSASTIGARSVSIGADNIASGTGSVAIGKGIKVYDDYSVIVGENNVDIENVNTAEHMPTAFAVGANLTTPFAVLKSGAIVMSAVNSGKSAEQAFGAYSRTNISITFEAEYPSTPFVFLTINENNVPNNQGDITDYGRIQIYLQSADTTGFTATVVNGSDSSHTFSFSWFAISVM